MSDSISTNLPEASAPVESAPQESTIQAEAQVSEQTAVEEAPKPQKIKLSNGEELDETEVLSGLNHIKEANKRFQEAAMERRAAAEEKARIAKEKEELEKTYEKIKTDPWEVIKSLGLDPTELSTNYLVEMLEQEQMTPEQKRIKELEEKTSSYEKLEAERRSQEEKLQRLAEEAKKEEEMEKLKLEAAKHYEDSFIKALSATVLPVDEKYVRRVGDIVYQSYIEGSEIPIEFAAKLVEAEYLEGLATLAKSLDSDKLIKILGEEGVSKVTKSQIAKIKNPSPKPSLPDVKPESRATKTTPSYMDPHEFIKELKKKHGVI